MERVLSLGDVPGFSREVIGRQGSFPVLLFHRAARIGARRICLSAGIHGDEAAGPCALAQLLGEGFDFGGAGVAIFPALAPDALMAGTRTNRGGVDLNRDYRHLKTDEVRAHLAALVRLGRFDVGICLHEDWEARGSYIYETARGHGKGRAELLLSAMEKHVAADMREEIDGMRAEGGIIRPKLSAADFPEWPEAIFLTENHCDVVYTIETPSAFALERRVAAQCAAVRLACELLARLSSARPGGRAYWD